MPARRPFHLFWVGLLVDGMSTIGLLSMPLVNPQGAVPILSIDEQEWKVEKL